MSTQLEVVEAQALNLSVDERAKLADRLITSLFEDHEIEEAWAVEVERRIEEIESGRAKLIPVSDAISRSRAARRAEKRSAFRRMIGQPGNSCVRRIALR